MIFQKKEIKDDTNKFLIVDSEIDMNNSKDETKKRDISFDSDKFVKNKKEFFKNHIGYTSRIILNSIIPIITLILSILFILSISYRCVQRNLFRIQSNSLHIQEYPFYFFFLSKFKSFTIFLIIASCWASFCPK